MLESKPETVNAVIRHFRIRAYPLDKPDEYTIKAGESLVFFFDGSVQKFKQRKLNPDDPKVDITEIINRFAVLFSVDPELTMKVFPSPRKPGNLFPKNDFQINFVQGPNRFEFISGFSKEDLETRVKEYDDQKSTFN